ncbi:MAG TPA: protein translocase subunit SecD [Thermogutta sp.]|nr:protein translocase subunit SecD [Thermogutta sp.]
MDRRVTSLRRFGLTLGVPVVFAIFALVLAAPLPVGSSARAEQAPAVAEGPQLPAASVTNQGENAQSSGTVAPETPAPSEKVAPSADQEQPEKQTAVATAQETPAPGGQTSPAPQAAEKAPGEGQLSGLLNALIYLGFLLLIIGLPVGLAYFICEQWRLREYFGRLSFVFFTIVVAIVIILTRWPPKLGIDLSGGVIMVYEIEGAVRQPGERAQADRDQIDMDQLIAALNRRVNPSGVKEVTIRRFGPQQIEIIVPEVNEEEVARLERVISSIGTLEFRILANQRDHRRLIERAMALSPDEQELYDDRGNLLAWWVPVAKGQEAAIGTGGEIAVRMGRYRNEDWLQVLVVKDRYNVTGADLFRVSEDVDERMQPCVSFVLRAGSAQRFGALTSENRPDATTGFERRLGIILDGYLYSAPNLRQPIFDRGQITGIPTREEVQALIQVLQAGSLPAVLSPTPISRLVTGPQLGRDTIRQSVTAMIVAAVIVFAFMVAYYRFAGIVACLAVVLNLVMLVAIMILLKAAFTLPGLAGLTLTVGMAVDANVLIYERIREELSRKATLRMAIRNGFEKAMSVIIDSNLTTMLTAVVLYFVGTDQVRGFAVTLFLGLVLNLYTAVFMARIIFEIGERRKWIKQLYMMRIIGETNFDFTGVKKYALAGSVAVILLGLVALIARGPGVLDIDFTGGVAVEILFNKPKDIGEVRYRLRELRDLAVSDVRIEGEQPHRRYVINTSSPPGVEAEQYLRSVKEKIAQVFGDELVHYSVQIENLSQEGTTYVPRRGFPNLMLAGSPWGSALAGVLVGASGEETSQTGEAGQSGPATEQGPKLPEAQGANPTAQDTAAAETPSGPPADRFAGGTRVLMKFDHKVNYETIESHLKEELAKLPEPDRNAAFEIYNKEYRRGDTTGYENWEIRLALPPEKGLKVVEKVQKRFESTPYFPSSNTIGGKVASSTRVRAVYALILSVFGMIVYLWVRFTKVSFGVAAAVALVHDVLVTLGLIALSAYLTGILGFLLIDEFKIGLSVLAAFLTIIGYSVNDTIIIFDRIREVKGKAPYLTPRIVNTSINQTLSRTIITSLTTLFVVVVLYIGGGAGIHAFSFTLLVGVITGTYSSIFIASPLLLWLSPQPVGPASQPQSLQHVS